MNPAAALCLDPPAWRTTLWLTLVLVSQLLGCTTGQLVTQDTQRPTDPSEGLAVTLLSGPQYENVVLSPDGSLLAAVRREDSGDALIVRSTAEGGVERVLLTEERNAGRASDIRRILRLGWASNERLVYSIETAYHSEEDGIEEMRGRDRRLGGERHVGLGRRARKTRLYASTLDGHKKYLGRNLPDAAVSQYQDDVIHWLPKDPDSILIRYHGEARRVDVATGRSKVIQAVRFGTSGWIADHTGAIRAGVKFHFASTDETLYARTSVDDSWKELSRYHPYDERGFRFAGFSEDPHRIYVYSDLESDRTVLQEFDLARNELGPVVFEDPEFDVDLGWLQDSPVDGRLLAIHYYRDRLETHIVDPEWRHRWERAQTHFGDAQLRVISQDATGRRFIVEAWPRNDPPGLYFFDSKTGDIHWLLDLYPGLAETHFPSTRPIRFLARDGLEIRGFLTRPSGSHGPGPTVVYPHDGPAARDIIQWDPIVQFLVSRGLTVFQPNYRGSVGHGRKHARAGDLEWGHAVQHDIADSANWLISQGIAHPDQIGIFGQGFGGYIALEALIETPEVFRAGAAWGGIGDLIDLRSNGAHAWRVATEQQLVGDLLADRARLLAVSPAHQAHRVTVPVLLGHGEMDPEIDPNHSRDVARALERDGNEVELYRYEGELDRFLDDRNRIDFYLRLAAFFDEHLLDPDDSGSSASTR